MQASSNSKGLKHILLSTTPDALLTLDWMQTLQQSVMKRVQQGSSDSPADCVVVHIDLSETSHHFQLIACTIRLSIILISSARTLRKAEIRRRSCASANWLLLLNAAGA